MSWFGPGYPIRETEVAKTNDEAEAMESTLKKEYIENEFTMNPRNLSYRLEGMKAGWRARAEWNGGNVAEKPEPKAAELKVQYSGSGIMSVSKDEVFRESNKKLAEQTRSAAESDQDLIASFSKNIFSRMKNEMGIEAKAPTSESSGIPVYECKSCNEVMASKNQECKCGFSWADTENIVQAMSGRGEIEPASSSEFDEDACMLSYDAHDTRVSSYCSFKAGALWQYAQQSEKIADYEAALEDVLRRVNQCHSITCDSCLQALEDTRETLAKWKVSTK